MINRKGINTVTEDRYFVSDEDLEAIVRFNQLSIADKARIIVYLKDHEDDIANSTNDFGDFYRPFKRLFNRDPCS